MEACNECLRLENRLRAVSEHYAELILQHRQIMRNGNSEASTLDSMLKNARRRRNTAGRLLMDHWINHAAFVSPQDNDSGSALTGVAVPVLLQRRRFVAEAESEDNKRKLKKGRLTHLPSALEDHRCRSSSCLEGSV